MADGQTTGELTVTIQGASVVAGAEVLATPSATGAVARKKFETGLSLTMTIAPGEYTITLAAPPMGFLLPEPAVVTVIAGQTALATLTVAAAGSLSVHVANDEAPPKPVVGAKFVVLSGSTEKAALETGADGRAGSGPLLPGAYVLHQQTAPANGLVAADEQVQVGPGDATPITLVNAVGASVVVRSMSTSGQGLGGSTVVVTGSNGFARTIEPTAAGADLGPVVPGAYTFEQRGAPPGHELPRETTLVVTLSPGDNPTVEFRNSPVGGAVTAGRPVGMTFSVLSLVGLLAFGALALKASRWDQLFATGVMFTGLALLTWTHRDKSGFFGPLVGEDGRYSTSKTQLGIWTIAVVWAMAFLVGRVTFAGALPIKDQATLNQQAADNAAEVDADKTATTAKPTDDKVVSTPDRIDAAIPDDRLDEYLLLLGGPFAAAVLARMVVSRKVVEGKVQKTISEAEQASLSQVFQDDEGRTDLVDAQYLLFNLVALGYFIAEFVQHTQLPKMPMTLLGLTSGAAAVYVGNKASSENQPVITAITPPIARPGETVVIRGQHFMPSNSTKEGHPTVYLETVGPMQITADTSSSITVVVPPTAASGQLDVTVTTPTGVSAAAWPLTVEADTAQVLSVESGHAVRGATLTVIGRRFRSALEPTASSVTVWVGDRPHSAPIDSAGNGLDRATVLPGDGLTGVPVISIAVQPQGGQKSPPLTVPVAG